MSENKNPFPGLRPFLEDEENIYFGRESQVDTMVDRLAANNFLAVVGTSGSGKSSLVNCGLIPALHGGLMTKAGSDWRIAIFRPGNNPILEMAKALAKDKVLFQDFNSSSITLSEFIETTLQMGKLGLVDLYAQSHLDKDVNLLLVVDQFEELFRYRPQNSKHSNSVYKAYSRALVNLLIEAAQQNKYPIHIVITMRSDFLGDCAEFPNLAEAISASQYLVPRLTRDERRAAIRGPIELYGEEISPLLLTRLVNDVGDNPDQLSILQHALNRTWAYWQDNEGGKGQIGIAHYEAIGTMKEALNNHAEKAYRELRSIRSRKVCKDLFKAITDKASDPRGVRRPTTLEDLCAILNATEKEIIDVIDVYRKPSRSFLTPPVGITIDKNSTIDISHESLMRVWKRLDKWANEEAESAKMYVRLASTSRLNKEDKADLWRGTDLKLALEWRRRELPTYAWAKRYDEKFDLVIDFIDRSKDDYEKQKKIKRYQTNATRLRNLAILVVLGILLFNLNNVISNESIGKINIQEIYQTDLRDQNIIILPDTLNFDTTFKNPKNSQSQLEENFQNLDLLSSLKIKTKILADGHDPEHINDAIGMKQISIPDVVVLDSPYKKDSEESQNHDSNPKLLKESIRQHGRLSIAHEKSWKKIYALSNTSELSNIISQKIFARDLLEKHGIVFLNDSIFRGLLRTGLVTIYLVPEKIDVMRSINKQSKIIGFISKFPSLKDQLTKHPKIVPKVDNIGLMFIHILGYFIFILLMGFIYRKIAFNPVGLSPLEKFKQWLLRNGKKFINIFSTREWNYLLTSTFLLAALIFSLRWLLLKSDFWMPLLALVMFLLTPFKDVLKEKMALEIRLTQSSLLKILGYYLLILGFLYLFNSGFQNNQVLLGILGLVLIAFAYMKNYLTQEEKILRFPDRSPVLYYKSVEKEARTPKSIINRYFGSYTGNLDEKLLNHAFGKIGPFIELTFQEDNLPLQGLKQNGEEKGGKFPSLEIINRSELVILQIDDKSSKYIFEKLRRALEILQPNQLLIYFSTRVEEDNLNNLYRSLLVETKGLFPRPLPKTIDANRIIAFDEDWRPSTFGQLPKRKFWWARAFPLINRRWTNYLSLRSFKKSLIPLFSKRSKTSSQAKLFTDNAIGLAGFYLFGFGIPAGIMMCSNFWKLNQKLRALFSLIAPIIVLILFFLYVGALFFIVGFEEGFEDQLPMITFYLIGIFGSPFVVYWLWQKIKTKKVRDHLAYSVSSQPRWLNMFLIFSIPLIYFLALTGIDGGFMETGYKYSANDYVLEGYDFASEGKVESAINSYGEAQKMDRGIDLNPNTEEIENDPKKVAMRLAAKYNVENGIYQAESGNAEGAILSFKKALELDHEIKLGPESKKFKNDPTIFAYKLAAQSQVNKGIKLAQESKKEDAILLFKEALELDPGIDLNPETEEIDNDPEWTATELERQAPNFKKAINYVWQGYELAIRDSIEGATVLWNEANELRPGMDLNPYTEEIETDPKKVAGYFYEQYASKLAKKGNVLAAEKLYAKAEENDPSLLKDSGYWNSMAWNYCLGGHHEKATDPSEAAVNFAESSENPIDLPYSLDTRGLTKALNGEFKGAKEDFERAITFSSFANYKPKRVKWIATLKKDKNPISRAVLDSLKLE